MNFESNDNSMNKADKLIKPEETKSSEEVVKTAAQDALENPEFVTSLEAAKTEEEAVGSKYDEALESVKEHQTPEEIKNKIKEYQQRAEDYTALITIQTRDTGLSSLARFGGAGLQDMVARYPGLEKINNQMQVIANKTKTGLKFWKEPEMDGTTEQAFKNKLISGRFGLFRGPNGQKIEEDISKKFADFSRETNPVEEGKNEVPFESARDIILGNYDLKSLQNKIKELEDELASPEKMAA